MSARRERVLRRQRRQPAPSPPAKSNPLQGVGARGTRVLKNQRQPRDVARGAVPDAQQVAAVAALGSFRFFVEEAWPVVVPAEPFQPNWHIDAICDHLEAVDKLQIRNLLINIPPRFGKSTIVSVLFTAWLWLRDPTLRLLYSSYSQSLSTRDSVATRQLIESPWYQARWGSYFQIAPDQNEKTRFENNHKGYRLATSVGGANTGEDRLLKISAVESPANGSPEIRADS